MRLYPWNMTSAVLTIIGLMMLGAFPPVGLLILLVAAVLRVRFTSRIRYWEKIYQARQDEKDRRERIAAFRSIK